MTLQKFKTIQFKKDILSVIITILLIFLILNVKAQPPKDTTKTIPVHYSEAIRMIAEIQRAQNLYHRLDISALKRDTLDSYLNDIALFFNRRGGSVYADTTKAKKKSK
ncbi:MAG TPA: hypothetical protein VNX01_06155 [Bacteroidia bacterium]|nr:hypothetical protein [Bacteroidia bacterium]